MRTLPRLAGTALLLFALTASAKATIVIVNGDGAGTGFNDPATRTPVGGNPGTTLGEQRLAVFQAAAAIWGEALDSDIPITVLAHFQPLACSSTAGSVLGSAAPTNIFASDDPTLDGGVPPSAFPRPKTWYVSAQTQSFASVQLLPGTGEDPANYDIVARFNSALDDPQNADCGGLTWYYGLDGQHGDAEDLLIVVLHEFGHGLGFLSLTDESTGELPNNEPDIWSYFQYDESSGKHWKDLTAADRKSSAVSGGLVWDGASVIAAVPHTLAFPPLLRVTSAPNTPSVVKDYGQVRVAQFSGPIPEDGGVSGPLGVGSTGFGCTSQGRLDPLDGRIAILDRGGPNDAGCTFVEKARNAQDAGAIGLMIANNVADPPLLIPSGTAPDVTIPVLMMTQADGTSLKTAVGAGAVNASILRDASQGYAGTDAAHRPLLYAPAALSVGSSVSHWDVSEFPNLLMEPFISPDLDHGLDLTVPLFRDIGWFPVNLAITGSGPSSLGAGQQGTFNFTVNNPGPYVAPAVTITSVLTGLSFVSNSGDCTGAFPCALGDLATGQSRTFSTTLKAGTTSNGKASITATANSVSSTSNANVAALTVQVPTPSSSGGGGGCTTALGPPAPWLALLGLLGLSRRRRRP